MTVTVSWHDPEATISCVTFRGSVTFDEMMDAWTQEINLLRSKPYLVYSLNIFDNVPIAMKGLNLRRMRAFAQANTVPNLQMTVQVSDSPVFRVALSSIMPKLPHEQHVVATEAEAMQLIHDYRKHLSI
ncbi:MAG: hypothetical protein AAF125_22465 [Chloroflexota bacterium]